MAKLIDLTNQRFGKLIVLERDYEYPKIKQLKNNKAYWKCQCDCGNIKTIGGFNLRNQSVTSCGCNKIKDLTNQKFYKLTALYPTLNRSGESVVWHCKCDCGNETEVSSHNLINHKVLSCGCIKQSIGESNIEKILNENKIIFIKEKIFDDFIYLDTQKHPRFDFYLPDYNRLIEYDGEQHYRESSWSNENKTLQQRQINDSLKNNYAKSHNIDLVRIPYWERDLITLDMLLGNQYLL